MSGNFGLVAPDGEEASGEPLLGQDVYDAIGKTWNKAPIRVLTEDGVEYDVIDVAYDNQSDVGYLKVRER